MRAIDLYRKYKNRQISKDLLDRLASILPYKRYLELKKFNESLERDQPSKEDQAIAPTKENVSHDADIA